MIEGFDKEIDAILRKARGVEAVGVFDAHLDAEDISAFAENVLPPKIRQNYTAHLADCNRCRQILSNVIEMNSAEVQTVSSAVAPQIVAETSIPWYRSLFAMPNLAYTMGALVLVFGGFLGFMVLQNFDNAIGEVSSVANKSMPQIAPDYPSESSSANANSVSTTANTSANTATVTNSAPTYSSNSATSNSMTNSSIKSAETSATPQVPTLQTEENKESVKQKSETQDLARTNPAPTVNQPITGGVMREDNKSQDDKDASSADSKIRDEEVQKPKTTRAIPQMPRKTDSPTEITRQAGGKTFRKLGGIWFDSEYGTQKQISIRRGTSEYKKLDSGLRSIADQFSGTVVILWKSKAYRIQ